MWYKPLFNISPPFFPIFSLLDGFKNCTLFCNCWLVSIQPLKRHHRAEYFMKLQVEFLAIFSMGYLFHQFKGFLTKHNGVKNNNSFKHNDIYSKSIFIKRSSPNFRFLHEKRILRIWLIFESNQAWIVNSIEIKMQLLRKIVKAHSSCVS